MASCIIPPEHKVEIVQYGRANEILGQENKCQVEVGARIPINDFLDRDYIEQTGFETIDMRCHMRWRVACGRDPVGWTIGNSPYWHSYRRELLVEEAQRERATKRIQPSRRRKRNSRLDNIFVFFGMLHSCTLIDSCVFLEKWSTNVCMWHLWIKEDLKNKWRAICKWGSTKRAIFSECKVQGYAPFVNKRIREEQVKDYL